MCGTRVGRLHTVFALVVVTAPGVKARLGKDIPPLISGMMKLGSWTPVRSGPPVAWPGTAGATAAGPVGCPDEPHPVIRRAPQSTANGQLR